MAKQAADFQEALNRIETAKVRDEIWMVIDALSGSINSVLDDDEMDPAGKQAAIVKTVAEFSAAVSGCVSNWCAGKTAGLQKKDGGSTRPQKTGAGGSTRRELADPDDAADEDVDEGNEEEQEEEEMTIDKSRMSPEDRAAYEELVKKYAPAGEGGSGAAAPGAQSGAADPAVQKREPGQPAAPSAVSAEIQNELEELRKFREDMELERMVTFAKKYEVIGKKPDELGRKLLAAKAAGGTAYNDMVSILDEMVALQESSDSFHEIGKSVSGGTIADSGNAAWEKIEKKADELQAANPDLKRHQAIDMACMQNPTLVHEYEGTM